MIVPGSARASRAICGALAAKRLFSSQFVRCGAGRFSRGRVRSPGLLLATVTVGFLALLRAQAAEVIPPKPDRYFNDGAGIVSKEAANRFDEQLAQFERATSNQLVVAIYAKMQSDSDIADYTQRVAQSWGVGQKGINNGVVLFVFPQDRKMFIQTGYGTEGAIPDATAFEITEYNIKPHFRNNDYEGGLATGIDLIQKALKGEYKGSGRTVAEGRSRGSPLGGFIFFVIFVVVLIMIARAQHRRPGYRYSSAGGPFIGGWSGGSGGGWSSGAGGFSGGGGSFGGGGAGSSW